MKRKATIGVLAALALGAGVTAAQKDKPAAPPVKPGENKPAEKARGGGEIILTSRGGTHDDQKGISQLTGNVVVRQEGEDFILYADGVTYDRNANQAVASGNLRVETKDSTITGTSLRANFDSKHIFIKGNVVMDSHGKDNGMKKPPPKTSSPADAVGELSHKPSKMTCDTIDFNYDIREALVTGNIHLTQGETSGTCRQITFDEENNVAKLEGNVSFTDKKKQTFETDTLINWFDTGRMEFTGPVKFKGRKDETEPEPGKAPPPRQPKWNPGKAPEVPDLDKEAPPEKEKPAGGAASTNG